jgi:drug/metabolite transporter (DMT)-like permease
MSGASLGYIIAFLSMLVASFATFPFTNAAREWGSIALNHFRLLLAFVVLTLLCAILDKISLAEVFSSPSAWQYIYLGSSGIIGLMIGDYFGFHSMAILGARESSIFGTLAPGAALLFGYLFLGETLNIFGIIGVAISIGGMIWFLKGSGTAEDKAINIHEYGSIKKGIVFGILSGLCQGFHITLSKKGLLLSPALSPIHATWIRVFAATVAYFGFTFARGKLKSDVIDVINRKRKTILKATLATIFGLVLSVALVMWCVTLCKVSVAQTILSMSPIIVVPMAYVLYKQKLTMKTIMAAIVSVSGVFMLIWRDTIVSWLGQYFH